MSRIKGPNARQTTRRVFVMAPKRAAGKRERDGTNRLCNFVQINVQTNADIKNSNWKRYQDIKEIKKQVVLWRLTERVKVVTTNDFGRTYLRLMVNTVVDCCGRTYLCVLGRLVFWEQPSLFLWPRKPAKPPTTKLRLAPKTSSGAFTTSWDSRRCSLIGPILACAAQRPFLLV